MGGLEVSARRRKRDAKKRKREDQAWAAKSGPVRSYFDPSVIEANASESPGIAAQQTALPRVRYLYGTPAV
jgi:hypothetical protein